MTTTILYADDDFLSVSKDKWKEHPFYEALLFALEKAGVEHPIIEVATTGAETYHKLCQKKYDGLILDIMMPQGDDAPAFINEVPFHQVGLVLAEQLCQSKDKEDEMKKPDKILILTASPISDDRKTLDDLCQRTEGTWDLMFKPSLFKDIANFFKGNCDE